MSDLATFLRALGPKAPASTINALAQEAPDILRMNGIDTDLREAHFWAQAAHETGGFRWFTEIWGPTPAQKRYERRKDLGNVQTGDGYRYRGRGIFQLTGRANYERYGELIGIDLLRNPDEASQPATALRIACEYWRDHDLNALADKDDLVGLTRKINGGTNGIQDRKACLILAKKMWCDEQPSDAPEKTMVASKQGNGAIAVSALAGLGAAAGYGHGAGSASHPQTAQERARRGVRGLLAMRAQGLHGELGVPWRGRLVYAVPLLLGADGPGGEAASSVER